MLGSLVHNKTYRLNAVGKRKSYFDFVNRFVLKEVAVVLILFNFFAAELSMQETRIREQKQKIEDLKKELDFVSSTKL